MNQGIPGLIGFAVKGVSSGIGLASEGVSAYRADRRSKSKISTVKSEEDTLSGGNNRNETTMQSVPDQEDEKRSHELQEEETDEQAWDLDDAQDQITPTPTQSPEEDVPKDGKKIIDKFIWRHPPPLSTDRVGSARLSLPVILPQKRPKDRQRGFIKAYAPILEEVGVDQATFLDFLETFNQASQASPWMNALNLAGLATLAMPHVIGTVVGIVITMAVKQAMEMQSRSRTNSFLDCINDEFFRPRGLFCLVMTWNPESAATSHEINLISTISSRNSSNNADNPSHKLTRKFKPSSGDMEFPIAAPLIFPALDSLASASGADAEQKRSKVKKVGGFVGDYWDRRAQAKFEGKHPDAVLNDRPEARFQSRFADPNHPVNSGSLFSLVSGGHFNPPSLGQMGRGMGGGRGFGVGGGPAPPVFVRSFDNMGKGAARERQELGGGGRGMVEMGYGGDHGYGGGGVRYQRGGFGSGRGAGGLGGFGGPQAIVKKILKKDVLYLLIVNMPTDEEMAAVAAATGRAG